MKPTRSGVGVLLASAIVAALGWWWGYLELLVLGIVGVLVVATAWLAIRRPVGLEVSPRSSPRRVSRGEVVACRILLTNSGQRAVPSVTLIDSLLDERAETFVVGIAPGDRVTIDYGLPVGRRGVHEIGPLLLRRQDLLGLMSFEREVGPVDEVIVHPRVHSLAGSRGMDHITDAEAQLLRATQDPLAGFQALRDYVSGDDPRTIHWPSTARAGHLVVREFVDARRPQLMVILDTSASSHTADGFEEAVDVAASLTAHAVRAGLDVVLRTNDRQHRGQPMSVRSEIELLDLLARVVVTMGDETLPFAPLVTLDGLDDSVVVITGPHGTFPRLPQLAERLTIVRIGGLESMRRVGVIAAADAEGFARSWVVGS